MPSRTLPGWKRATAAGTAVFLLMMSVGPQLALATTATGTVETGTRQDEQVEQQQQEKLTIGVLDLDYNNVTQEESKTISERLRIWLGRQPIFQVIERNKMESIMEEVGFQFSGACNIEDECVIQVGQILGASKMVAGSVSQVGNVYTLQVRLVDMATSRVETTDFEDVRGIEAVLQEATEKVAKKLAEEVTRNLGIEPQVEQQEQQEVQREAIRQQEQEAQKPVAGEDEPLQKKKFKWWYVALGMIAGGGALALIGGGSEGPNTIPTPPSRPVIPPQ